MSTNHKTLVRVFTTLTDYVERTTHWREGGADRHDAKLALKDVGEMLDDVEWTEKGLAEWRDVALSNEKQARAAQATARIAITHLQAVLNQSRTHTDQQAADTAARDWLVSIGSDPT
jgi:superfamily II RNA helicase